MSKMTIMQGLPASGKSTRAELAVSINGNTVRINKDLLRKMLHFGKFTHKNESLTRDAARKLADWYLANDINIIIDDTNLNPSTVQSWVDLAKLHGAKIEHVKMDTSVEDCITRDVLREDNVGEHVILKMAMQWMGYGAGKETVICDLDGTLCDIQHRLHHVQGEKKDWKAFFAGIPNDEVRSDVVTKLLEEEDNERQIIFVSARPEEYREVTEQWIESKAFFGYCIHLVLIMRESGDKRPDTDVKRDIYNKYLKHLNIVRVYDDRPSVIRMWRELGLEVVDVGNGVEF